MTIASIESAFGAAVVGALVAGYVLGSIPFGLMFGWLAGAGDVRNIGSGNIGATNVLRTGKRWAAAATLICDAAKGAVAVLAARHFGAEAALAAGFGAVFGHVFPIWLGFRGGKGVATFLGTVLALDWRAGLLAIGLWLLVAVLFRISSLSALVAVAATPICFVALGRPSASLTTAILALLIFLTHRANILRLVSGEEPRIGRNSAGKQ